MAIRLLCTLAIGIAMLVMSPPGLRAGGPRTIAGTNYFDPAVKGTPLTWSQGAISYDTDRGTLSPILPSATADAFVADAFSQWTSIPTAAVSAARAGQLAEDVSGANVSASGRNYCLAIRHPAIRKQFSSRHRLRR